MTLKAKKVLLAIVCAFLAVLMAFACVNIIVDATDDVEPLKSEYVVGQTVAIPEQEIGGVKAESVVHFPSGYAIKANSVSLSESGTYKVEYKAIVDGELQTKVETFVAHRPTFSFSGDASYYEYGVDKNETYDTGKTGVHFKLAQGETLTFEQTFNIHELGNKEFINFYVTPTVKGVYDVQAIYIYVIDVNDENNFIKIKFQAVPFGGNNYVHLCGYTHAAYNDQILSSENGEDVRRNDRFGVGTWLSLYGNADTVSTGGGGPHQAIKHQFAAFSYDSESMELFKIDNKATARIVDFDDPKFFDQAWSGFSTGDVKIKIEGYSYTNKYLNLDVTSYGGIDFGTTAPVEYAEDTEAPVIEIDFDGYDEFSLPKGIKGEKYKIFDAVSRDSYDGMVKVDAKVFYAYNSSNPVQINIENGYVKTDKAGRYGIEYTATDSSGYVGKKVVYFYVEDKTSTLDFTIADYDTATKVGIPINLATVSVNGAVGDYSVEYSIDKKAKINKKANTFTPLETGEYTIVYKVTDFTGKIISKEYTVTVSANENPVVLEDVNISDYIIAGSEYTFPTVTALNFNTNKEVATKVYVDGQLAEDNKFIPSKDKIGQTLTVTYKADGFDTAVYTDYVIPFQGKDYFCYTCNKIIPESEWENYKHATNCVGEKPGSAQERVIFHKYWMGDVETSGDANQIYIEANKTGEATFSYVKPLMFDKFSINFAIDPAKANFNELEFKLVDATNEENFVRFSLLKGDDGFTYFTFNGEKTIYKFNQAGFYQYAENEFMTLSIVDGKLSDGNSVGQLISNIFSALRVNVEVTMKGITGDAGIIVKNFFGQALGSKAGTATDKAAPVATYVGTIKSMNYIGETLYLPALVAEDTLDPSVVNTITVTAPNGEVVLKADANKETSIVLDQYGLYSIMYESIDSSGRRTFFEEFSTCINTVKPEITVSGKVPTSIVLNGTVTLPKATAVDDVDGAIEVKYFVIEPTGTIRLLDSTRKFKVTRSGRYTARFYAVDSSGNATIVDQIFVVGG